MVGEEWMDARKDVEMCGMKEGEDRRKGKKRAGKEKKRDKGKEVRKEALMRRWRRGGHG